MEDYISINGTFGFFDLSSKSSEIELGFGPSQIKIFFYYLSSLFEDFSDPSEV
jgi:hypothetical protein